MKVIKDLWKDIQTTNLFQNLPRIFPSLNHSNSGKIITMPLRYHSVNTEKNSPHTHTISISLSFAFFPVFLLCGNLYSSLFRPNVCLQMYPPILHNTTAMKMAFCNTSRYVRSSYIVHKVEIIYRPSLRDLLTNKLSNFPIRMCEKTYMAKPKTAYARYIVPTTTTRMMM